MNGWIWASMVSCVVKKGGTTYDEHGYFSTILQLLRRTTLQQYLSKRQTRCRLHGSCNAGKGSQRAIQKT